MHYQRAEFRDGRRSEPSARPTASQQNWVDYIGFPTGVKSQSAIREAWDVVRIADQ
jgi:hypothetical protein